MKDAIWIVVVVCIIIIVGVAVGLHSRTIYKAGYQDGQIDYAIGKIKWVRQLNGNREMVFQYGIEPITSKDVSNMRPEGMK